MTADETERYATAASRWAGVGPYYAMFPFRFALEAVRAHTRPGDVVLDPFAGRGTSLFAASSEGRVGLGIEINPVGWVYGKAKLQTASRGAVEARIKELGQKASMFIPETAGLPEFFRHCYTPEVLAFLLAARVDLDWRRSKTDWTTMALLLVDLHGKRESALSNQMRQTKAMAPRYAVAWWTERGLSPPPRDPVAHMMKKAQWRYAKGRMERRGGVLYLGDSRRLLPRMIQQSRRAALLLTSPPYFGVTNYFYDQWLRLWLLGGPAKPTRRNHPCAVRFENKRKYAQLLRDVFERCAPHLRSTAVVQVRTDSRPFALDSTIQALEQAFPGKKLRQQIRSTPDFTQTGLFNGEIPQTSEVDLVLW